MIFRSLFFLLGSIFLFTTSGFSQSLELVNSPYDEQNPVLSPDQKVLYFTRANHPQNVGGKSDPGDIWYSELLSNNTWGPPKHGGSNINSDGWNGVFGFNKEGTVMYLHHHYAENRTPKTQGFAFSKKVGNNWTIPVNITIPYFKNMSKEQSGWISGDENVMLISVDSYNTRGNEDIYVILKNANGTWRDPISLGGVINTEYQEFYPYYSEEDSTLYFASNGFKGYGSVDILMSKRMDASWRNWMDPVVLGDSVNSQGRDLGFMNFPLHNFAIYTSTINSDGYGDIRIHRYGKAPESDEEKRRIFVLSTKTGEYIDASVKLEDSNEQDYELRASTEGADVSSFAPGAYTATVTSPGHLSMQQNIEIGAGSDNITIALQPLEKGTRMVLEDVLFAQSKADILPESYDQLDLVAQVMKDNPDMKIMLEGHTDTRGNPRANLKLSKLRVEAVKDYLVDKGVSKRRIDGKGYGGKHPLYPEDTEESRKKNRRVEFVIMN